MTYERREKRRKNNEHLYEAIGGGNHLRGFCIPDQARSFLHTLRLAGARNHCYSCTRRRDCLQNLETQTQLQLVKGGRT